jgi:hypothetical protein
MQRLALALLAMSTLPACAATAPAPQTQPAARTPKLDPALQSLAFYVGSWDCKGTWFTDTGQVEKQWSAGIQVEPELDGKWLSVKMTGPDDNRTVEHKGYDPTSKRWIHVAVANDGSWVALSAPGWTGASMVFSPDQPDGTHATFTRLSDTSYSHEVTRDTERGPATLSKKVCTKS